MVDSPDEVMFTIDSRLLEELGENLVTRNHVAVSELIKNSYDADATEVILEFEDASADNPTGSEIRVRDDGSGMSLVEVRDDFMRIATTDKLRNPKSEKYGREKSGNKGIGRFACRRLAHVLDLTTTSYLEDDEVYERTSLEIDWRRYEADQEIEEVTFKPDIERYPGDEDLSTGTTICLRDLQDSWTQRDFDTLRRNVVSLAVVQPRDRGPQYEYDPGFDIEFDVPEFEKGEGTLSEQIHEASWGCLEGQISETGEISLNLDAKLIGERSYSFTTDASGLGGTSFKISYVPLDTKAHYRDPQTLSITRAREITQEQGGVRVYKGGFRVFSYGGPDDDWLGIDQDRGTHKGRSPDETFKGISDSLELHIDFNRVLLSGPNNRNLIGRVMIDSDADLTMASNREDFIDDDLFDDLRKIVRLSLQWLTLQWSNYKALQKKERLKEETEKFNQEIKDSETRDSTDEDSKKTLDQWSTNKSDEESTTSGPSGKSTESEKSKEPVDSALNLLEGVASTATETVPEQDRQVSDEAVETATKVIRGSLDQKEQEIDFFRSAFSVNQVVFSFSHELRSMVNDLASNASKIETTLDDLPENQRSKFLDVITDLRAMQDRFESQMELFGIFMETGNRKQAEPVSISEVVDDVVDATEYIANYYGVDTSTEIPTLLKTPPMYKSELYSIVVNLVTNSIKAIGTTAEDGGEILVEGTSTDEGISLRVYDNGVGIPKEAREEAFEPLISDPADNIYDDLSQQMPEELSEQLGKGTGLGLSIVRNIAEKHGGHAKFVEVDEWTTCMEVTINE
ncbi:sensor histidine kinase [Haloprofundus salinisoli]|uniref:sensor histidine kinase n=1 Tax=Haloprofundus salinisoli TaxID=2876193 RepID=UPI001CCE77EC|nr:sensor histidine kinase [Haloprofundus salinisoli]